MSQSQFSYSRLLFLVGSLAVLGACASVDQDKAFSDFKQSLGERVSQDLVWRRGGEADGAVDARISELLAKPLTLDGAVQAALLNNRDLQARYAELGIAQADLVAAGLLSNPVFELMVRPTTNPSEFANLEFALAQNILDLFQRPARLRVAEAAYAGTQSAVAQGVIATINEVRHAYVEAVGARNALSVKAEVETAAAASSQLAQRFHEAGNISDLELAEEREAYEDAALESIALDLEAKEATETLAALLNVAPAQLTIAGNLPEPPKSDPPAEGLEAIALERRFDMIAARKAIDAALADLKLKTDWRLWKDVELTLSAEREGDKQWAIGPSIALALPLFDQGQPEVAQAAAAALKAENEARALEAEIRRDVRTAAHRVTAARKMIERYRTSALPLKQDIARLKQEEYNFMLIGVFEVLVARREQSEAFHGYVETVRDYWLARADLANATGGGPLSTGETP
ncbi:MAG: TolC family protein [Rhodospirillaceae bacterium]|nr:TolC family protein [Rhodospirillaceae bacterium]